MAEIKRVTDQYTITAPTVIIDGNLSIRGSTTTVEATNSAITDNIIVLNSGETGAGVVTLGSTAGIQVERGSLSNVSILWNESSDTWQLTNDGSIFENIMTGTPGAITAPGSDTWLIYNDTGNLGAEAALSYDRTTNTLTVDSVSIGSNTVSVTTTNANLTLSANGTGVVKVTHATALTQLGSAPSLVSGSSIVYGATPGAAASGLYYVNSVGNDELMSKRRAFLFARIM